MNLLLASDSEITIETATGTNAFLDEEGKFVSPSEAAHNIKSMVEEWDIIGKLTSNLPKIILFIVIIVIGILLAKLVSKLIVKGMKKTGVDASVYLFLKRAVSAFIVVAACLIALGLFINVNSLLATLAAAGVAIALGLQNSVAQLVSGIQILVTRPFKSGDFISVDGVEGNIVEIRFMNTIVNTIDNKRVIIPNSTMTASKVINFSAEKSRRVDLIYSISYSDDIEKAKRVILDYIRTNELIYTDPEPVVYVMSHEASSIDLVSRVWCDTVNYWPVYFAMQENVKKEFDKNGVCIPFNQLDVHVIAPTEK